MERVPFFQRLQEEMAAVDLSIANGPHTPLSGTEGVIAEMPEEAKRLFCIIFELQRLLPTALVPKAFEEELKTTLPQTELLRLLQRTFAKADESANSSDKGVCLIKSEMGFLRELMFKLINHAFVGTVAFPVAVRSNWQVVVPRMLDEKDDPLVEYNKSFVTQNSYLPLLAMIAETLPEINLSSAPEPLFEVGEGESLIGISDSEEVKRLFALYSSLNTIYQTTNCSSPFPSNRKHAMVMNPDLMRSYKTLKLAEMKVVIVDVLFWRSFKDPFLDQTISGSGDKGFKARGGWKLVRVN